MIGTTFVKAHYDPKEYTQAAEWCNANGATIIDCGEYWEVVSLPAPTLEERKESAIELLKQARDTAEVQPIEVDGDRYDYDDKARDRIHAALIALDGTDDTLSWTTADNTETTVNADRLRTVVRAVAVRADLLHRAYRTRKAQIASATCTDEIDAILAEEGLSV